MLLTESLSSTMDPIGEDIIMSDPLDENAQQISIPANTMILELMDLVEMLRNHSEGEDDPESFGVELGMQRASDMIEHLVIRHRNSGINHG